MPYEQFIFQKPQPENRPSDTISPNKKTTTTEQHPTLATQQSGSEYFFPHETEDFIETRVAGGNPTFIEEVAVWSSDNQKKIFLVDTKAEKNPFFSELMTRGINKTLRTWGSVQIICNKNSYAKGTICDKCGHIPQCKQCDITISFHKPTDGDEFGMCHMCKSYYKTPKKCSMCRKGNMKTYGLGIQQVAEFIQAEHKIKPLIINSPIANSLPKIQKITETSKQHHVIIGTSLIITANPHHNTIQKEQKKWLTILLNADAPLSLPDYEATANCFHLIYDTITTSPYNNIIIQTQKPDHPTIRLACAGKKVLFVEQDATWKKQHQYPPFGDVCVLMYKNEIEKNVFSTVNKLYQELLYLKEREKKESTITIYATPPLIYKAYNKYRYNIIIRGKDIRNFVENAYKKLKIASRGFKIDRQAKEII